MPSKCSSVDLPAPEGPMMETNSPSLISTLMRRSTKVLVGPCSKYFSTFRSVRIGELIVYVPIVGQVLSPHLHAGLRFATRIVAPSASARTNDHHSYRSATMGSTEVARRAGMNVAASAIKISSAETAAKVAASV